MLNLMDTKRSCMVKTLNIMDANINGFTVIDTHQFYHNEIITCGEKEPLVAAYMTSGLGFPLPHKKSCM